MDFFQRVCVKEGVIFGDVHADESEIFDAEEGHYEEEQQAIEEEEPLDTKALYDELECMKRRVQRMQLLLKLKNEDECPGEECMDYEVLLKCSENKEICELQKNQYKLQCQVDEVVRCFKVVKEQIADIRSRMCEQAKQLREIQKLTALLNSWRLELEHEFGLCLERFEYIKHVKAEWADVHEKLEKQRKCFLTREQKLVPKYCYIKDKKDFIGIVGEMRAQIHELFQFMQQRFEMFEQRLYPRYDEMQSEFYTDTQSTFKASVSQKHSQSSQF